MDTLKILYPKLDVSSFPKSQLDLLPRHKGDQERANRLKDVPYEELAPLMPHLIYWLQDMNWPISDAIADLFVKKGSANLDLIRNVLASDDVMWKYWVLKAVVDKNISGVANKVIPSLVVLTSSDEEDLADLALRILKRVLKS
jgi:hypothetical protein